MINSEVSKAISLVRFPLSCLIVFIHVPLIVNIGGGIYDVFVRFWSQGVCHLAVPLFFIISGYLFCSIPLTLNSYFSKIRKRVKSLLIPYIVWNGVALLIILLPHLDLYNLGFGNVLASFWDTGKSFLHTPSHSPINFPLWYVRDLMICCVVAPLLYTICVRKWGFILPIILSILYVVDFHSPIVGLSTIAVTFFTLGLWLRCADIKPYNGEKLPIISTIAYLVLLFAYSVTAIDIVETRNIIILLGIASALLSIRYIGSIEKTKFGDWLITLADCAFFIYLSHVIFVGRLFSLLTKYVEPTICPTFVTIFSVLITIFICVVLYFVAIKIVPKWAEIVVGKK